MDVIEICRIQESLEKNPERFLARIYTDSEVRYCEGQRNRFQHYAVRFAAKEAAMKALGTGWGSGIRFVDIEVQRGLSGRPVLVFSGVAGEIFESLGARESFVTLSHCREYAVAHVILVS